MHEMLSSVKNYEKCMERQGQLMKIAAIIAEYNPFHNGHEYMVKKIRKEMDADYIIAVMSGDFTQRGVPAITDKFTRAKMAVLCGVDAVFELPVVYATAGAEGFAYGAVSLLHGLGCVNYLVFGSEYGDIRPFHEVSDFLHKEPEHFKKSLLKYQKLGFSYPKAFSLAIKESELEAEDSLELLSSPNNLLGLEYMKALKQLSSSIEPITISRIGTGYHDTHTEFCAEAGTDIASASAIRTKLETTTGTIASAMPLMPEAAYKIFTENYGTAAPVVLDDFSLLLSYRLSLETRESLTTYLDVSSDLADRIMKYRDEFCSFSDFIAKLKHKQYTHTRITRSLLHVLLGITKELASIADAPYARLLAMKKCASPLMKELKVNAQIPVITKAADAKKVLSEDAMKLFSLDVAGTNLYNKVTATKFHSEFWQDMKHNIELL